MPGADAEFPAQPLTARGVDDLRPAPLVLHYTNVANPHAVREARAHGLDHGFLGGKAHRQKPRRALRARELRALGGHQQTLDKVLAEASVGALDALLPQDVDADPVDHRRARCICACISRTAEPRPSNTAWAMIAWPMLSSVISAMAATGPTLR